MSLGKSYVSRFKIGDYVTWRSLCGDSPDYYDEFHGIIVEIINYNEHTRPVHYAKILELKSNDHIYVVLSCLSKLKN